MKIVYLINENIYIKMNIKIKFSILLV